MERKKNKYHKKIKSNKGFLGYTHALSAVSIFLLLLALVPQFIFGKVIQSTNLTIFVSAVFTVAGAALMPDFDNSKSTAISTLGILGKAISKLLRSLAVVIYTITKTRYDNPEPNPHRGFWHTILSGILIGLFINMTTAIPIQVTIPYVHKTVSLGYVLGIVWFFIFIKLAIAGLFGKFVKKIKNKGILYQIIVDILALVWVVYVLNVTGELADYKWIGYTAMLGYTIHLIGDTFTKDGAPLFFPFKHKGKRWWHYRILGGITAGGTVEDMIFVPVFISIIIFSCYTIFKTVVLV